jgi:peroxiredoxin
MRPKSSLAQLSLTAIFSVVALLVPVHALALSIGDPIPAKSDQLKDVDGRDIKIADVSGAKGTLVIFTCNHCPYVKAWEDRIVALGNQYSEKGIGVVAINSNDPKAAPDDGYEQMQARAKEKGFKFPYAVDETSAVAKAFGASKTPEAFLFDASGKLAYHGAIDDNSEDANAVKDHYLGDALAAVEAGKPVAKAETKALGCGIKFR